jgi:hypothetical protein
MVWNGVSVKIPQRQTAPLELQGSNSSMRYAYFRFPISFSHPISFRVWSKVTSALLSRDWPTAEVEKRSVEVAQRKIRATREKLGKIWNPQHFHLEGQNWAYKHAK